MGFPFPFVGLEGHTFCVIHFCVMHPIFKETHEVMQSVIQNFAWYKVSYLQWNKVSYYFFSDVEWHTIGEILYLQEQEYQAPPVILFFLLQTPTTWLYKDCLVPRSQKFEFMSRPGLRILGGLPDPSRNFELFFSFKVPQRGLPWSPAVKICGL